MSTSAATETLGTLFAEQVAQRPEAIALVDATGATFSYRALADRAAELAARLRARGLDHEDRIAVAAPRSPDLVVAILGVLEAGGVCVPLDPLQPLERRRGMAHDADVRWILTAHEHGLFDDAKEIAIAQREELAAPAKSDVSPKSAAFILYTSGTTGRPKGVVLEHHAIAHYARSVARLWRLRPGDRVLQFTSPGFDVALEEMFGCWAAGGTLVLRPDDLDARALLAQAAHAEVRVLCLPTAYWAEVVDDLGDAPWPSTIAVVMIGGERVDEARITAWKARHAPRLVNAYGPTEATVSITWRDTSEPDDAPTAGGSLVGYPTPHADVRILDGDLRPVADGEIGEIYAAGIAVARGYWRDHELTAERFVTDAEGNRMYRTGDLGRRRSDGAITFIGRVDDQIKLSGYRIEPGEIEAVLTTLDGVLGAAVVAIEGRLVAFLLASPEAALDRLHSDLANVLPPYMIPRRFVTLDAFPRTPRGKIDRAALVLPAVDPSEPQASPSPLEAQLCTLIGEVLGLDRAVAPNEDFFALGGSSLLAIRLLSRIRRHFSVDLGVLAFAEKATAAALARAIDAARSAIEVDL